MDWDAIVIGSGFGGAMAAYPLVEAGQRVLMIERGSWVARGPQNWGASGVGLVTPHYSLESAYDVFASNRRYRAGSWQCVGGQSVFYGCASFRFRERDFEPCADIVGDSGASWPIAYDDLEPFYSAAETLLNVAGQAGADPTEPPRSSPYPQPPAALSRPAQTIAKAATSLGLTPFCIPLAISYAARDEGRACIRCGTCDGYACAADAKNDLATVVLPSLVRRGLTLRTNTVCVRLVRTGSRIAQVECVDRVTGEHQRMSATTVILAAGALATPHLLLASNLTDCSPAGDAVGRYLMRHRNTLALGVFAREPNPERTFDKQIAIHDFYYGSPDWDARRGTLGGIQQLTPSVGLVRAYLPLLVRDPAAALVSHMMGLLVIAEDQPRPENRVEIVASQRDRYGLPRLRVHHAHTIRDNAAAAALAVQAKRILRTASAGLTYLHPIETFSHALGTVRMGLEPRTSPLSVYGQYRGLDNLFVTDASALPRSAGVNPSLTIAANALRIGSYIAGTPLPFAIRSRHQLPVYPSTIPAGVSG